MNRDEYSTIDWRINRIFNGNKITATGRRRLRCSEIILK
jgi:hypothetical protein